MSQCVCHKDGEDMMQEDIRELAGLVKPVSQWLNDHGTPHSIIVVEQDRFDLYDGRCGGGLMYNCSEANEETQP